MKDLFDYYHGQIITRTPHWSVDSVRAACIRNNLFTEGTNEEYAELMAFVLKIKTPSDIGLFEAASYIAEHSDDQTAANVLFILANEAVSYSFEIDGEDFEEATA